MHEMLEAIRGVVGAEPEGDTQPDSTQPDGGIIETQLTHEITTLWSDHVRLSANHKTTAKELRQIRAKLAEGLFSVKATLCRPNLGRASQWRGWLKLQGIPRSTADRLVARHAETLCSYDESVLSGATSKQAETEAEKLARVVWARFRKVLASDEVVIDFIDRFAEISGVGHEQRAEGLVIFKLVPKAADELPGSASATDLAPQPADSGNADGGEPAAETAIDTPATEHLAGDGDGCAEAAA